MFFLRRIRVFLLAFLVVLFIPPLSCRSASLKISGPYSGLLSWTLSDYSLTIPLLSPDSLDQYVEGQPHTALLGLHVYFETDETKDGAEYELFVYRNQWFLMKPSAPETFDVNVGSGETKFYFGNNKTGTRLSFPRKMIEEEVKSVWTQTTLTKDIPLQQRTVANVPVTLRAAMEAAKPRYQKSAADLLKKDEYREIAKLAAKAGVDLSRELDKEFICGCNGESMFLLYYTDTKAIGSDKQYLIQRVRIQREQFDEQGQKRAPDSIVYLVEVFKTNYRDDQKGADQHYKSYGLQASYKRKVRVDIEIGVGEIPGQVKGDSWPYARNLRYYKIQDYAPQAGLYDQVVYDYSTKYAYTFEFDRTGAYTVDLSEFIVPQKEPLVKKGNAG
ncbi:MAG: hypothetical protein C4527_15070 [Candidatus Omnitrophota bacterium]|jgi:hypothetical protein|nr:MAG: hypothetical protein C4527_15070 [Candidatus Omnitrophota bacterium]